MRLRFGTSALCGAALVVCTLCGKAWGQGAPPTANSTFTILTDQPTYTAPPNTEITITLLLRETFGVAGAAYWDTTGNRLVGAGLGAVRSVAPSSPAKITFIGALTTNFDSDFSTYAPDDIGNPADPFDDIPNGGTPFGDHAELSASRVQTGVAALSGSGANFRQITLGTLRVQTGLIPLQSTVFSLDEMPTTDDFITGFGQKLDAFVNTTGPTTFSVTVIPEPASAGIIGLAATPLLLRRRRASR